MLFARALLVVCLSSVAASQLKLLPAALDQRLPVKKVVLYKNGVGYFEHEQRVRGTQDLSINFTTAQLDDVLKSLTVLDLGSGRITGVRYNSIAPLEQRLRSLRLPIGEYTNQAGFLSAIRGARVEVRSGTAVFAGRLLSVENKTRIKSDVRADYTEISVVSDAGDLRAFELGPGTSVRIAERDLNEEVGRYMNLVSSTRERDLRRMTISSEGAGDRTIFVSYISEVPVWKSTYRIVLPTDEKKKPFIQGWAIVDNTVGEDWKDVELSLVAGAPQSFVQRISQPHYSRRPTVAISAAASLTPQSHEAALYARNAAPPPPVAAIVAGGTGAGGGFGGSSFRVADAAAQGAVPGGSIWGQVFDPSGAIVANAQIIVTGQGGTFNSRSDGSGNFSVSGLPQGNYQVRILAAGFNETVQHANVSTYAGARLNAALQVGGVGETVAVMGSADAVETSSAMLSSNAYEMDEAEIAEPAEIGELFEYKLKQRVTIGKNQSALVPILQSAIDIEKVSIWSPGREHALRALWLTNNSGLSLDGGAFNIVEGGAFAGEGIFKVIKPNERRLLSYAADQSVRVHRTNENETGVYSRARVVKGIMYRTTEFRKVTNYTVTNSGEEKRAVLIEHERDETLDLDDGIEPEETTDSLYRFKVDVTDSEYQKLRIVETRPHEDSFQLMHLNDEQLTIFMTQRSIPASLEALLRPIITKKSELASFEQQIRDRQQNINTIGLDQSRLRENMKALKGSAEEKALLQRYTKQLNDQEDRLEAIRLEIVSLEQKRDVARTDLSNLIMNLTFDEKM